MQIGSVNFEGLLQILEEPWALPEGQKVSNLVHSVGLGWWGTIASHLPKRSGKQVRERRLNYLDRVKQDGNVSPFRYFFEKSAILWEFADFSKK